MRNIIRIGAGTDRRNRFVAIALGVALAAGPASPKPAGTADDGQAAGAAPLASTHPPFPHIHRRRSRLLGIGADTHWHAPNPAAHRR